MGPPPIDFWRMFRPLLWSPFIQSFHTFLFPIINKAIYLYKQTPYFAHSGSVDLEVDNIPTTRDSHTHSPPPPRRHNFATTYPTYNIYLWLHPRKLDKNARRHNEYRESINGSPRLPGVTISRLRRVRIEEENQYQCHTRRQWKSKAGQTEGGEGVCSMPCKESPLRCYAEVSYHSRWGGHVFELHDGRDQMCDWGEQKTEVSLPSFFGSSAAFLGIRG